MKYSLEWLKEQSSRKQQFEFVFFWGHIDRKNEGIGKFCLSHWYESPFIVNKILYNTAEHWMMYRKAMQFDDFYSAQEVLRAETPEVAQSIGRTIKNYDNDNWHLPSFEMVRLGNIHKFNQHPDLLAYLLKQKNKILVEASPYDNKWGIGLNANDKAIYHVEKWQGTNFLGFVLMEVCDFFTEFGTFDYLTNYLLRPCDHFKNYNRADVFWQRKEVEIYEKQFEEYYENLSERDKTIFDICNPVRSTF